MKRNPENTKTLSRHLEENLQVLKKDLGFGVNFDVLVREIRVASKDAVLIWIDGLTSDALIQRILDRLFDLPAGELVPDAAHKLIRQEVNFSEVETTDNLEYLIMRVLSGMAALLVDGEDEAVLMDVRSYPGRNPQEPDLERVVRGSRDGFVETLVYNTALIRRRLRDRSLRIEVLQVGNRSKTDVAILYLQDVVNLDLLKDVKDRISKIVTDGIPMAEKSVEEFITEKRNWWNPFPVVRYTERPDAAAIHLLEGHIVVLADTSPSAIILPVTLFHHIQHAEEYRENPLVGAYLRWVRFLGILTAWAFPPVWISLVFEKNALPEWLKFIGPKTQTPIPIALQFVVAEIGVDLIRIGLIHTPSSLATAIGFIGAILLGEMATKVGLFVPETVMYVALAAIGTFATPSMEFSQAIRLSRIFLLIVAGIFGFPGLAAGVAMVFLRLLTTRSFGVPYLWPLIPFEFGALKAVFVRLPVPSHWVRPSALKPQEVARLPEGGGTASDRGAREAGDRRGDQKNKGTRTRTTKKGRR
ncbi:MAG TPA: spore germination protein [Clostridia bacterium]|nr:spore germination protein [Clostridia bacterium]